MVPDPLREPRSDGPALDHVEGAALVESRRSELAAAPGDAAKERPLLVTRDTRRGEVGIDLGLGIVMGGQLVKLPHLLVEPEPPTLAVLVVVRDPHVDDGADPGKGVNHDADERPVAQTDHGVGLDRVEKCSGLLGG
jgi:hypothetical protein